MIIPVILAGGSGTRLWPLSRQLYPKQLLNIYNDNTMLQNTVSRLGGIENISPPIIVCNEEHRFMTAEQLRLIKVKPAEIILEPVGRNTAPAIAVAALKALQGNDKNQEEADIDPVLLVLPADHAIEDNAGFHDAVSSGFEYAQQNRLITFGIVPDKPETGYGYIRQGPVLDKNRKIAEIEKFVEKPDRKTAEKYLESGVYTWNSGMFMFRASLIIRELENHAPEILEGCRLVMERSTRDLDFLRLGLDDFKKIPSDSIDYAVMEKTDKGVVIPLDAGWNDMGSFDALWQTGKKDENRNVIKGDALLHDVRETYINSEKSLVAAVGLEKFVIVETKDALFVSPRDRVQDVKKIVEKLKAENRSEAVNHSRVYRPWGDYETIDIAQRYQVKRITVKPGAKLSLQKHYHRAEHWTVVSGSAVITKGEEEILLKEDESAYIPLGTVHRLENPGKIPLELIEVQSGPYLGEDDIVRFDDVYGRNKQP